SIQRRCMAKKDHPTGLLERKILSPSRVMIAAWIMEIDQPRIIVDLDNKIAEEFTAENAVYNSPRLFLPFLIYIDALVASVSGGFVIAFIQRHSQQILV